MFILDVFLPAVFARERCARKALVAMIAYGVMSVDMPREVSLLYWRLAR